MRVSLSNDRIKAIVDPLLLLLASFHIRAEYISVVVRACSSGGATFVETQRVSFMDETLVFTCVKFERNILELESKFSSKL